MLIIVVKTIFFKNSLIRCLLRKGYRGVLNAGDALFWNVRRGRAPHLKNSFIYFYFCFLTVYMHIIEI